MQEPPISRRLRRGFLGAAPALAGLALLTAAAPALAQTALRADLVEAKSVKLDGLPKEWTGLTSLTTAVKGQPKKPDLEAKGAIAYDNTHLFIAADVTDDTYKPGLDHVVLVLGFPGGTSYEVSLYPGDPGKTAGSAKLAGKDIPGAKVVEAVKSGGYSLEASIPWSAFAMASSVRVGLRGGLFVHDADGSAVDAIAGSAKSAAYASLPQLATESEQALADGLIKQKGLKGAPKYNLLGDVAGDSMKERVLVYDRYLIVLGSHFRKGSEYYFSDMGVDANSGMVPACELKDVTGDGQQEIVIRKRFGTSTKYREALQVLHFGKSEVPNILFQHEVSIVTPEGSVENTVTQLQDGSKVAFRFEPGARVFPRQQLQGGHRSATTTPPSSLVHHQEPDLQVRRQQVQQDDPKRSRTPPPPPSPPPPHRPHPPSPPPPAPQSSSTRSTPFTRRTAAPPARPSSTWRSTWAPTSRPSVSSFTERTSSSSEKASRAAPATRTSLSSSSPPPPTSPT
ncbi:MAG: hypothetical protein R3F14_19915 [Polyangiaceae bacterium]